LLPRELNCRLYEAMCVLLLIVVFMSPFVHRLPSAVCCWKETLSQHCSLRNMLRHSLRELQAPDIQRRAFYARMLLRSDQIHLPINIWSPITSQRHTLFALLQTQRRGVSLEERTLPVVRLRGLDRANLALCSQLCRHAWLLWIYVTNWRTAG
jgi:hypothetical protein